MAPWKLACSLPVEMGGHGLRQATEFSAQLEAVIVSQLVIWSGAVLIVLVVLLLARVRTSTGHEGCSRLFSWCLFGHAPRVWTRNDQNVTVLRCPECLQDLPILARPAIKGPRHQQGTIAGQPKERARVIRVDNVRKFETQSER